MPRLLYLQRKSPWYPLDRKLEVITVVITCWHMHTCKKEKHEGSINCHRTCLNFIIIQHHFPDSPECTEMDCHKYIIFLQTAFPINTWNCYASILKFHQTSYTTNFNYTTLYNTDTGIKKCKRVYTNSICTHYGLFTVTENSFPFQLCRLISNSL
jgi:hypothetical protein